MLARLLRTKRKSASAQRYLRSLGATIAMANLIMRPSKGCSQRRIIVWMFTKSQLGGRCGYWVWSPSGNCWALVRTVGGAKHARMVGVRVPETRPQADPKGAQAGGGWEARWRRPAAAC